MKREILFHGKRTDNGEWVEGGICTFPDGRVAILNHRTLGAQWWDEKNFVIPETVGQYVGKTDAKGAKVFTGDVITRRILPLEETFTSQIIYNEERCMFAFKDIDRQNEYRLDTIFYDEYEIYIVGNIYDNADLLTGAQR